MRLVDEFCNGWKSEKVFGLRSCWPKKDAFGDLTIINGGRGWNKRTRPWGLVQVGKGRQQSKTNAFKFTWRTTTTDGEMNGLARGKSMTKTRFERMTFWMRRIIPTGIRRATAAPLGRSQCCHSTDICKSHLPT
nr:hypothetical protein CFP56_11091 [Quercus suber]